MARAERARGEHASLPRLTCFGRIAELRAGSVTRLPSSFETSNASNILAHPDLPRRGLDFADQMTAAMGNENLKEAFDAWSMRTLEGLLPKLKVPYLILNGENDRLVPLHFAERSLKEAVKSPRAELKVFSIAEGSSEHCGVDLVATHTQYMFDGVAEIFGGKLKAS